MSRDGKKRQPSILKRRVVKNLKLLQNLECDGIQPAVILVSRIMHYFTILTKETNKIKMGKNIYLVLEPDEIVKYRTIETDYPNESGEDVLKRTAIYSSNEHNYLSLFKSDHPENIWKHYHSNWIYYAGLYTQLWNERILEYGGHIDEDEQKVHWGKMKILKKYFIICMDIILRNNQQRFNKIIFQL